MLDQPVVEVGKDECLTVLGLQANVAYFFLGMWLLWLRA